MTIPPTGTAEPLTAFASPGDGSSVAAVQPSPRSHGLPGSHGLLGSHAARTHYLAEATDASDLARRAAAWDRAQAIYRGQ